MLKTVTCFYRCSSVAAVAAAAMCVTAAHGQVDLIEQQQIDVRVDSGAVAADDEAAGDGGPQVVFSEVVEAGDAPWLRVHFDEVSLAGSVNAGDGAFLRLTSLHDGAEQRLDARTIEQWQHASAFFNGSRVRVELFATPGTGESRVVIDGLTAGVTEDGGGMSATICDGQDERELSDDPRAGRTIRQTSGGQLARCSVFLFDDREQCFLTAGHCITSNMIMAEFNVPMSQPGGTPVFSDPDDQYPIVSSSTAGEANGVGEDWGVFAVFENSNTGMTPLQAQGASYQTAESAPFPDPGDEVTRTGFGVTNNTNLPGSWHRVQKTSYGAYVDMSGTVIEHRADTTSGDSGSPIVDSQTGLLIGIHTHGGCGSNPSSANHGTAIHHPDLQAAITNAHAFCHNTCGPADLDCDGAVNGADLGALLSAWGPCDQPNNCPADLTGDGTVGGADLGVLLSEWTG